MKISILFYLSVLQYFFLVKIFARTDSIPLLSIHKTSSPVIIDGELDEPAWQMSDIAKHFFQNYPYDTSLALSKTQVRILYDGNNIYIGAICYDELQGNFIIQSLKRDFSYEDNDGFAVFIDPFNDKTNGYTFAVTPSGVQQEGLIESGSKEAVSNVWDNKWFSNVKNYDNKWIVEMAIPFKIIKYKDDISEWRINFSRNDLKRNERSAWARVPKNFKPSSLGHTGILLWDVPPKKAGLNAAVIPYSTGGMNKNYIKGEVPNTIFNAGADIKLAVTSSLNLDITVNPDFSQIEVDQQQVNLTRFNLFYPEKRQFFIENSDLFANFGFSQIRPFFSRKIGFYEGQTVPIIAGARLSGKINRKVRIGIMDLQTVEKNSLNFPGQNYFVTAFQRQIFGRSNIAGIFVNRQASDTGKTNFNTKDYNRIAGLDFNILSNDSRWQGKVFYHTSFTSEKQEQNFASAGWLSYNTRNLFWMWNHEYVGKNYTADAGYVPRNVTAHHGTGMEMKQAYIRIEPSVQYKFYPVSGIINYHGPAFYTDDYFDGNFSVTDYFLMPYYIVNFRNTGDFQVHYHEFFTKLFYETDITFTGNKPIPAGNYYYRNLMLKYQSDKRKLFSYFLQGRYGTHYNGNFISYKTDLAYRIQPWVNFSLGFSEDEVLMPEPYKNSYIALITQKVEMTFTPSLYFTVFTQYNTQVRNMNLNARFQWRFRPMSDFYIVYTENYASGDFIVKDRAIVAKLIWWLNL